MLLLKPLYTIILLLLMANWVLANTWQGDYYIQSEIEANNFKTQCNCTTINGNLIVQGDDIIHLDSLHLLLIILV